MERFAEDSELQDEIRLLGGVPLVLALLRSVVTRCRSCNKRLVRRAFPLPGGSGLGMRQCDPAIKFENVTCCTFFEVL